MDDSIHPTQDPNQAGANPAPAPSNGAAPAGAASVSCAPKGPSGQNEAPFDPNRAVEALSSAKPAPAIVSPRTLRRRFEELARRAAKDSLSGLLNRAAMEQCIGERLAALLPGEACALFIVDLDDFKQVNDTFGHQSGDQVIRQTGAILSSLFRASDIVGRLGGDEFAVFLSGSALTENAVRERADAVCKELQIALPGPPAKNVTASVGIYFALDGSREHFAGMYQAADLALYKAKKAGKHSFALNRTEGAEEEASTGYRTVSAIPLTDLLKELDSGVALLEMSDPPRVIYVSPSFCRLIGAKEELEPPVPLSRLIHPDDLLAFEAVVQEALANDRPAEHTHRVLSCDEDRTMWWHVRAVRVPYAEAKNPVLLVTANDISQYKETERHLKETNRLLQAAVDQTVLRLWEIDLKKRRYRSLGKGGPVSNGKWIENFPDCLVQSGWIHPDSISRLREFCAEMFTGAPRGWGNFVLRRRDTGCYGWSKLSYRTLFDDLGAAELAVGVVEYLPDSLLLWGFPPGPEHPLPAGLTADLMFSCQCDLTRDTVGELWSEGRTLQNVAQRTTCAQLLKRLRSRVFKEDAGKTAFPGFDSAQLLALFATGRRWFFTEYRRANRAGAIRSVRHVVHLAPDPKGGVLLSTCLLRAEFAQKLTHALPAPPAREALTGLYNAEGLKALAEELFAQPSQGSRAAVVVQAAGLLRLSDRPDAEKKRADIAAALSAALGGGCLLGTLDFEHFAIIYPTAFSQEELRRILEEAFSFLRRTIPGLEDLRFVAGAALQSAGPNADYNALLERARRVCGLWWNAPSDTVAFPHREEEERLFTALLSTEREDRVAVHLAEMDRPLSADEKDVAFRCLTSMLNAGSLEASIHAVLRDIGIYYCADRVYVLTLVENRRALTMPYEWTNSGKRSIQQSVSGLRLDRFPLLLRCLEERAPVFLTRNTPFSATGESPDPGPWHFTTFPLIRNEQVEGFLCIENSREHPADAALFSVLIPYLLRERERFGASGQAGRPEAVDRLMELPNLRTYLEAVNLLDSAHYSSLGAVCLDIPAMASINGTLGFEYGSRLLWFASKTLAELFGPSLLFRTWDAEFVAFCPNTTRQVFVGRVNRLRSILQRRYAQEVRIGSAWAEGEFSGKYLVSDARTRLHASPVPQTGVVSPAVLPFDGAQEMSVSDSARAGRFTLYFQPQIDMSTGKLLGAEALVRGVGEGGEIYPPARFIPLLEQNGGIRELDFFVLERALSLAAQWRAEGFAPLRVSTNLSRHTFLHPNTLASVLALQSRYPSVGPDDLELEITESASVDTAELKRIAERFRSCGLRLGLDDFGAQYANLSLFTSVKFDSVKLDRSLIAELAENPVNRLLVKDLVAICTACGMTCVAEGVETEAQTRALLEAGCRVAQGYYYDPPLPAEEFANKYLLPR